MLNTRHKIKIARTLSKVVIDIRRLFAFSNNIIKSRNGITWSLDLTEGIDFSIYLLGGFEVKTLNHYKKIIKPGNIVLDVGANIGAHTLPLAQLVGSTGKVIAFEPTQYAFNKLENNIKLNPALESRIQIHQLMLGRSKHENLPNSIYSSWPLHDKSGVHAIHHGKLKSTQGASLTSLDEYINITNLPQVNFIKLDVDGNEYDILIGSQNTLAKFKPIIMVELAPYTDPSLDVFDNMLYLLWDLGYQLVNIANGKKMPQNIDAVRKQIPIGGGVNAICHCM